MIEVKSASFLSKTFVIFLQYIFIKCTDVNKILYI